jgi:hypothetical protein
MKFLKIIFLVASLALLTACANISTVKSSKKTFENKTVVLIPTGPVKFESLSSVGASFGLIGVLIDNVVAANTRNQALRQLDESIGNGAALDIAKNTIESNSQKLGHIKKFIAMNPTMKNVEFIDWFNSDERKDLLKMETRPGDIAIDFGFQDLYLNNYIAGTYAEGAFGIRVIDLSTGKIIARARTHGAGVFGGVKLNVAKDDPKYPDELKSALTSLITKLTNEAIDKIAE